jgi:hypothetical protein
VIDTLSLGEIVGGKFVSASSGTALGTEYQSDMANRNSSARYIEETMLVACAE